MDDSRMDFEDGTVLGFDEGPVTVVQELAHTVSKRDFRFSIIITSLSLAIDTLTSIVYRYHFYYTLPLLSSLLPSLPPRFHLPFPKSQSSLNQSCVCILMWKNIFSVNCCRYFHCDLLCCFFCVRVGRA